MSTQMDDDDTQARFQSLEMGFNMITQEQALLASKISKISEGVEFLLNQRGPDETRVVDAPPSISISSPTPSVAATKPRKIKPSQPSEFDGNRAKGRAFINSCMLYIALCSGEFANDQQKICWVLSYMKKDRAAVFADRTLRAEHKNRTARFATWEAFYATYISLFCPPNEAIMALMKLETEEYYQNKRDVEEYIDEFEELVDLSGYTDPLAIVIKFRRGLNPIIQNKIAELAKDRPADDAPADWYAMARLFDQNRIANHAFQAPHKKSPALSNISGSTRSIFPRTLGSQVLHTPTSISQHRTAPSPTPNSGAQRTDHTPRACYRCGSLEHLAPQCKLKYDIRAMSLDEKEQLLEQLLADKDAVVESVEDVQSREEVGEASTDFVHRSG